MIRSDILKLSLFGLLMLFCLCAGADGIDKNTVRTIVDNFFSSANVASESNSFRGEPSLKEISLGDSAAAYLFCKDGHFVWIAGRDDLPPVLGYGQCNNETEVSEELISMSQRMKKGNTFFTEAVSTTAIAPMLYSGRSQNEPFNNNCPYYYNNGVQVGTKHCKLGCAVTALEQVISFYRKPEVLLDTLFWWTTEHYKVDTILAGTKIDFSNILDQYVSGNYMEANVKAVADLGYYCGIGIHMNWGLNESGANFDAIPKFLKRAFDYNYARYLNLTLYTPERWLELINTELENGRPIVYAGYLASQGGHAFNIDGRDSQGFYHINWGYGGNYDDYFELNTLNPFENPERHTAAGSQLGFCCGHEMLVLHPDSVAWIDGDTIHQGNNIRVDSVTFSRNPDVNGYVIVNVYVTNISDNNINATIELLSFAPGDTAIFKNAECVGHTGLSLNAHSVGCMTSFCTFSEFGERVFDISEDDSTFLYLDTFQVEAKTAGYGVTIEKVDSFRHDGLVYDFQILIQNKKTDAWARNLVTYSLFKGDYTTNGGEWRQCDVLNLAPGASQTDTVSFGTLEPATKYTFIVRNPWLPVATLPFVTPTPSGIETVSTDTETYKAAYSLDGQNVNFINRCGILIMKKNGKYRKVLVR